MAAYSPLLGFLLLFLLAGSLAAFLGLPSAFSRDGAGQTDDPSDPLMLYSVEPWSECVAPHRISVPSPCASTSHPPHTPPLELPSSSAISKWMTPI